MLFRLVADRLELDIRRLIPSGFRNQAREFVKGVGELTTDVRYQLQHEAVNGKERLLAVRKLNKLDHVQLTVEGIKVAKRLRDGQAMGLYTGDLYFNKSRDPRNNSLRLLVDLRYVVARPARISEANLEMCMCREGGGEGHGLPVFADWLKRFDVCFTTRTLKLSDYQWEVAASGERLPILVERKSYVDLVESIIVRFLLVEIPR